jgi:hypothetical protein
MHLVGRRNFLAGLGLGAGSHLLGSLVKSWLPEALGAEVSRKRLILFTAANGFLERFFTCAARSETDFDLANVYQPLAAYKDRLVIAHKFFVPFSKANHGNQYATLNVMETTNRSVSQFRGPPGGISIDRFIARKIGAGDAFSSTNVGCVRVRKSADPNQALSMSADGPDQPFPAFGLPERALAAYFRGGSAATGAAGGAAMGGGLEPAFGQDQPVRDLLRQDLQRLQRRLGGPERAKLDQYLESLAGLEREIAQRQAARGTCQQPAAAAGTAAGALNENLDPKVLEAMIDISFQAQKCGLTRVSHIAMEGMEAPHVKYRWLGETGDHHNDHHAYAYPVLEKIATWWFAQVKRMADALASTPEAGGTMLDNTVMVFINCCGGSHHDGQSRHPVVMLAGKNSGLRGGRYLQVPEGRHCLSDVYVSLANLFLDQPITSFGAPALCKGPLPGLV